MQNVSVLTQPISLKVFKRGPPPPHRKKGRNSEAKVISVSCNEDYSQAPYAHKFSSVVIGTQKRVTFRFKQKKKNVFSLVGNKNVCIDVRVQRVQV